jgi:predicted nucleic acid-binding protein
MVSDFASAEFASAIARRVRMERLTADEARLAFSTFDAWIARTARQVPMTSADVVAAASYLRRLDLSLRAPDAINIAIAQRLGAELFTFDKQMITSARVLGTTVVEARA